MKTQTDWRYLECEMEPPPPDVVGRSPSRQCLMQVIIGPGKSSSRFHVENLRFGI